MTLVIRRAKPPSRANTADMISKLRTVKKISFVGRIVHVRCDISEALTVRIPHVHEVKADDVVSGVAGPGGGLVQAVDVEAGGDHGEDAQEL